MSDTPVLDLSRLKAKLFKARLSLVEQQPFLGSLTLHLPVFVEPRPGLDTACVTSHGECYFDPAFLEQLDLPAVRAVLLHETLHLALDVFPRQEHRHPVLWNVAHDHAVNLLIEASEFPEDFLRWPKDFPPLLEPAFTGLNAERIYEKLVVSLVEAPPGWTGDVIVLPGQGRGSQASEALRDKWKDALIQAAEEALRTTSWGDLPAWVQRLVGPLLNPQVPWQERLAQKLHGRLAGRARTFAHPGRRSRAVGVTLPGPRRNLGVVGVFVDVSGSVGARELPAFLGELQGILGQVEAQVRLITRDAEVHEDLLLEPGDDLRALLAQGSIRITGGGGTDPRCVIRHLAEGQDDLPMPSYGVLLTDGGLDWPQVEAWPLDLLVVTTELMPPPTYDALALNLPTPSSH
jgi:predicted metal-dependent peptidase